MHRYCQGLAIAVAVIAFPLADARADDSQAVLAFSADAAATADLLEIRGGTALSIEELVMEGGALNIADQDVDNIVEGSVTGDTGIISVDPSAFNGQSMVINAFNTGVNAVMLNQMTLEVIVSDTPLSP